jgi:acetyl-CoA carboxylase biotin carboxylase subunit
VGAVLTARHPTPQRIIEVQVLADAHGTIVHLGERDCTLRCHGHVVLGESPAHFLSDEQRVGIHEQAIATAKTVGLVGVGTVEFHLDADGRATMSAFTCGLTTEHQLSELCYGIDIVREQVRIASGLPLRSAQDDVAPLGHAIACRIYAEDPAHAFTPCPGVIDSLVLPCGFGVRVDAALHAGLEVGAFYDPLVAKVATWGRSRNEAVGRMRRALEETLITGVPTNLELLYLLMYATDYLEGRAAPGFIEQNIASLLAPLAGER